MKAVLAPHLGREVKFGRRAPVSRGPRFRLKNYLRGAALPPPPASCDYSAAAEPVLRDVFDNNSLGDCVIAGAYHVVGVETGNAGALFHATEAQVLADYGAIGGYRPGDPSTDQGCDEYTAQNYWVSNGFANGTKLLGWLALDATNADEVRQACFLFENLYFGISLPDAWISPFPGADGFVWDVGTGDPNNGHCVMGFGYSAAGVLIDTWALKGTLTWAAIAALCTDAAGGSISVWLTPDQLTKGMAKAPNGVSWSDLLSDFDAMGGSAPLPPVPTPPAPVPGGAVSLAQAQAWATSPLASATAPLLTREQAVVLANQGLAAAWPASS